MSEALAVQHEPELSDLVVSTAIRLGATPRAIESAVSDRHDRGRIDPLIVLAGETGAGLTLIHELIDRWGINETR